MALIPGTRLGPYDITAPIGAGGMGQVFRAHDTKLHRDVAIKVLPEAFAHDADRLARFTREARALASLNHPHIASIYGLEESAGITALVMELVDGEDLSLRIARGAVPLDEALPIVKQIADALEAAHEQGIIHRDLKPANIKVRSDGTVKVLDFGLAKAMEPSASSSSSVEMSPTITTPAMTQVGMILGTAAYMAPEQARGKTVDKRADIWAFGCVLFEMLSGTRAFHGEDITDTLAAVVKLDPHWDAIGAAVPARVRQVLRVCLQKDPRQRAQAIGDVRLALDGAFETMSPQPTASRTVLSRWGWVIGATVGLFVGTVVAVTAAWMLARSRPIAHTVRFAIAPAGGQDILIESTKNISDVAIAPDGSFIVYRGGTTPPHLFVRLMSEVEARPLAGTVNARAPFISPDGKWVAFIADTPPGSEIRKVPFNGGTPFTVCHVTTDAAGGTWLTNDSIVFFGSAPYGLRTVSAGGGEPQALTTAPSGFETKHWFPSALPGGRGVLFNMFSGTVGETSRIAVLDLKSGRTKTLLTDGVLPQYSSSGHLVYGSAGEIRAVRFDLDSLEIKGDPLSIVDRVLTTGTVKLVHFAVSWSGTLVYVPGAVTVNLLSAPRALVWTDRTGREEPIPAPLRAYGLVRISPDGTHAALDARDQENDIWAWDLSRHTLSRLTLDPADDRGPVWTPDGRRIIFMSSRGGGENLYWQAADGTGAAERLTTGQESKLATSVSADGSRIAYIQSNGATGFDVGLLTIDGRRTERLLRSAFDMRNPEISPDGRWILYQSNESGAFEVYVRPFPTVDAARWQVSAGGGTRAQWSRDGREIFYLDRTKAMMAVVVQATASTFGAAQPVKLFDDQNYFTNLLQGRTHDASIDGKRFLMVKNTAPLAAATVATPIHLIVTEHWSEELNARLPK